MKEVMMQSNFLTSFLRTIVPLLVGAILALGAQYGFDLPEAALTELLTVLFTGVYYGFFRWLETKGVSWAGLFLGSRKQPEYDQAA